MSLDDLGLSEESVKLLSEVSIVYHAAASLRLDAKLKDSVKMNLDGTYRFLEICKTFKKLEVSTLLFHSYAFNYLPKDFDYFVNFYFLTHFHSTQF